MARAFTERIRRRSGGSTGPGSRSEKGSPRRSGTVGRLLGEKDSLFGAASRAFGWSFFSNVFGRFSLMGIGIVIARLLGPNEFGTAAVALVALQAVLSFNELGVSLSIVRWPGEPAEIAPTVTTISVASSAILYAGLFLGAPVFATAMGAPAATPVIRVLAFSVITDGIVSVPAALLQRYFRQGKKTIADQVHGWLGALVSVGLAWRGYGAMSLGVGQVVGSLAGGILIVIFSPSPFRLGFDIAKARKLLVFGLPLAGSSLIVFLIANVDNFIVGHLLGATALGFYVLAWNVASWPVNIFSQPVRTVAPAFFSRLQHDTATMRSGFASAVHLLGSVTLPVCLVISGLAVPLVRFVYGTRWEPAAQALLWLALLGALRILFELSYDYFVVLARSQVVFTVQLVWLFALVPSLIDGARLGGIRGVAIAGLLIAATIVLPLYLYELRKVEIRVRALAAGLWWPFVAAVAVGWAALAESRVIANDLIAVMIGGMVALVAIGLLCYNMRHVLTNLRPVITSGNASEPVGGSSGPLPAQPARVFDDTMPLGRVGYIPAPLPAHHIRSLPIYQDTVAFLRWDPTVPADDRNAGAPDDDTMAMPRVESDKEAS